MTPLLSQDTINIVRDWTVKIVIVNYDEDLIDEDGTYWKISGDLSFMYPMLEMSGEEHYVFMKDINYIYNEQNPLNDHKVNLKLVNEIATKIRNKKPYKKLIKT